MYPAVAISKFILTASVNATTQLKLNVVTIAYASINIKANHHVTPAIRILFLDGADRVNVDGILRLISIKDVHSNESQWPSDE